MSNSLVPFSAKVPTRLDSLFDDLFQAFWSSPSFVLERNWRPLEVSSTDKEYKVEIELPRVKKDQVKVESVDGSLCISVNTERVKFEKKFYYSDWDAEKSKVKLEDGVLIVTVPRIEPVSKLIKIE